MAKFFKCMICGNFTESIVDSGVPMICCGQEMDEVVADTQENVALEKHIPEVSVEGNKVSVVVGAVIHPMVPEHYIEWIHLETNLGGHRINLHPGEPPAATFHLAEGEVPVAAYEYCNLHGLWKKLF
ncbi:MAG: desulfoferrodoxin family protein [Bacilli bacterium]|jgi:superoxide reductase|nr:desulfoferrodoxin family protein [Bacilli bacterium]